MEAARAKAQATVKVDNSRVIVTEWRFPPGAETGWHRHAFDYVVCPVTDGTLLLETPDGEVRAELKIGEPYARETGVEHNVINAGNAELVFLEVELKNA